VCQTGLVPFPHGQASAVPAGTRFSGRWRYDRTAGRGIALCYDRSVIGPPAARLQDVHAGGRLTGRWRYHRATGRGIALSYDRGESGPPAATPARPEPRSPLVTQSPVVRVLCYCGEEFTFEGDSGSCPGCGELAEWRTMGVVEREMRSDLDELLRNPGQGADPRP
jgi:hypothetical protein